MIGAAAYGGSALRRALGMLAIGGLLAACGVPSEGLQQVPRGTSVGLTPPRVLPSTVPLPFYAATARTEPRYSNTDVLRNFLSIALYAEAADDTDQYGGIAISKWEGPVRYRLAGENPRDRVQVAALSQRLSRLTGLDIREAGPTESHNMDLRFVPPQYRGSEVAELLSSGWLGPQVAALASNWRDYESDRCFTLTTRHPDTGITGTAHIFIKDELDQVWRETCIIEELTQSLGLLNDDPRAMPSIFNDDGVYETLTSHDELLIQMLYDPRIQSGMKLQQVVPIAEQVIAELRPGEGA